MPAPPPRLSTRLGDVRSSPTVDQVAARTALEVADLDEHIALIRLEYGRRREALGLMRPGRPAAMAAAT